MTLKNMPKTRTSAQRYNARMENLFNKCQEAKKAEALRIVGNRARWELVAMEKALSKLELLNTPEEARRLAAVRVLLGKGI